MNVSKTEVLVQHLQPTVQVSNDPGIIQEAVRAVSEARAETASVVSQAARTVAGTQMEAAQAVSAARNASASTQVEAAKAVTEARGVASQAKAEVAFLQQELSDTKAREQALMAQVEQLRRELTSQKGNPNDTETVPASRVTCLETRLQAVEERLEQHQGFLQELWYSPPIPQEQPLQTQQDHSSGNPCQTWTRGERFPQKVFPDEIPLAQGSNASSPVHFRMDQANGSETEGMEGKDIEHRSLRTKEIHHLQLPSLPESAAQYRTWRNSVRTAVLAFDHSVEGHLTPWIGKAFSARGAESEELAVDSGSFPRFDRIIASLLCKQEALRTSFGLKVQAYIEMCELEGKSVRGRYILNLIASEYDCSHASTSITTSLELFTLPAPQESVAGLKLWRDKVAYILSQLQLIVGVWKLEKTSSHA